MRIFVTGGTGALGRNAVDALIADGHDVSALARTDDKATWLADRGARPVQVSLFDPSALTKAFDGHDTVANLASALPTTATFMLPWAWRNNDKVRIEGSVAVAQACRAAGVGRLIQESVAMIYRDGVADWIDETSPVDRYPMAKANHAAEENAADFSDTGGAGVVLRFGWFYGPGATHSEQFFSLAQHHICIVMGRPDTYVSSIHVEDAGRAVAAALTAPAGIYNVVDDQPLTKRHYADALARAADTTPWVRAPGRAALLLGNRTTSLTRSLRVANHKFRRATGWAPTYPNADDGWQRSAATFAEMTS